MILRALFVAAFVVLTSASFAMAESTSGLVDGLWFSQDPITDYEDVEVYAVVHNQTSSKIQGIATLVVDGEAVGAQEVSVGARGIQKVAIDHTFVAGSHNVSMNFTAGNGTEVTLTELAARTVFVVMDTDGDGVQNTTDPDDDNDTIPDEEDAEPLVYNVIPKEVTSISDTGKSFLKKITGRGTEEEIDSQEGSTELESVAVDAGTTTGTSSPELQTFINAFQALEAARKRGAVTMHQYEDVRRDALAQLEAEHEALAEANEEFELSNGEKSKVREHQIAAAGAATIGTVLEHGWMFYLHIVILVVSFVHLSWGWFKRRFTGGGEDEEE